MYLCVYICIWLLDCPRSVALLYVILRHSKSVSTYMYQQLARKNSTKISFWLTHNVHRYAIPWRHYTSSHTRLTRAGSGPGLSLTCRLGLLLHKNISPRGPGFWAKPAVKTPSPTSRPGLQKPESAVWSPTLHLTGPIRHYALPINSLQRKGKKATFLLYHRSFLNFSFPSLYIKYKIIKAPRHLIKNVLDSFWCKGFFHLDIHLI
jgi:hypothetical protein